MKRIALGLLLALSFACGSDSPAAPTPVASLAPTGSLSVQACQPPTVTGVSTCLLFSGIIKNSGPGCASNVRGTTTTQFASTGQQIGSAGWSYSSIVRPNEQFSYSGGPITIGNVVTGNWVYITSPSWDSVKCP